MYTNSGTTASYIKLFGLLLVLNILWFSVADDTRMRRSSTRAINTDVIDVTLYDIHRIFNRQNNQYRIYLSGLFDIQLKRKSSFTGRF